MFLTAVCGAALSLVGRVVSQGQMMKTAKVLVTRHVRHPIAEKVVRKRKTYLVRARALPFFIYKKKCWLGSRGGEAEAAVRSGGGSPASHAQVHDEAGQRLAGDVVRIQNCRPLSALKRFTIVEVLSEAERYTDPVTGKVTTKQN